MSHLSYIPAALLLYSSCSTLFTLLYLSQHSLAAGMNADVRRVFDYPLFLFQSFYCSLIVVCSVWYCQLMGAVLAPSQMVLYNGYFLVMCHI